MINIDGTYKTKSGFLVKLKDREGTAPYIIRGSFKVGEDLFEEEWTENGIYHLDHDTKLDLVEIKTIKRTVWLNMYPLETRGHVYPTKEQADRAAGFNRIACISVDVSFDEGDGL